MARFDAREAQAVAGPRKVLELAVLDGCQTYALAAHFGEKREGRCGHCTWCLNGFRSEMPAQRKPSPLPAGLDVLEFEALADQHPAALGLPRQRARFLCGLSSPAVSRARIMRNSLFGVWAERRFHDVLEWCESH
jgi:ATP-dependent DNA helicase RecQ